MPNYTELNAEPPAVRIDRLGTTTSKWTARVGDGNLDKRRCDECDAESGSAMPPSRTQKSHRIGWLSRYVWLPEVATGRTKRIVIKLGLLKGRRAA